MILKSKRLFYLLCLLLFLLIMLLSPLYTSDYFLILVSNILMYIVLTVSWTIFSGPTGYISLAPAAFFGIGIYTSAIMGSQFSLPVILATGAAAAFCCALLVGMVTLRLQGIYFTIFTFGLVELLGEVVQWWEVNVTGTTGRIVPGTEYTTVYYTMLGIAVVLMLTAYIIKHSRYGLALQSIGEYEEAAGHTGVNVTALKIVSFAVSALFMGACGVIMATRWTYIDPSIAFNPLFSFLPVLMAIFGGVAHLFGPVIGAVIFSYLEEFLTTQFPYYYMLIFGVILVIAIVYLPTGLTGLIRKLGGRLRRRHANT